MTFASPLDWTWIAAPLAALVLGVFLLLYGIVYFLGGHVHRGTAHMVIGLPLTLAGFALSLIVLNTQTFARLNYERGVAEIQVAATGPGPDFYRVTVRRLDGSNITSSCNLEGDEWLLSARVQKWKAWANTLGLDATYALDQVGNKYFTAMRGNGRAITACDLTPPAPPVNAYLPDGWIAWLMAQSYSEDRAFGSAVYMPMADGAIYRVIMTQAGLNAEPLNPIAKDAVARGI